MTKSLPLSLIEIAQSVSVQVKPRVPAKVYMHLLAEMGEFGEEMNIACGELYKEPGADGVVGEAADVINCVADLLWISAAGLRHHRAMSVDLDRYAGIESLDTCQPLADMKAARNEFSEATKALVPLQMLSTAQIASGDDAPFAAAMHIIRSVLICAKTERPTLTDEEFTHIFEAKCAKWLSKAR